jgi:hypothetical protein
MELAKIETSPKDETKEKPKRKTDRAVKALIPLIYLRASPRVRNRVSCLFALPYH